MAWLFHLEINNRGTFEVEALSSYIVRLARAHAVAPGLLLSSTFERSTSAGARYTSGALRAPISDLVRPNRTTEAVLESLASGLDCEVSALEQTTFVSMIDALDRPLRTFSSRLRWCPACIGEQRAAGEDPYYQLAWQALAMESCIRHRVRLRDRCFYCGASQDSFRHRASLGECVRCGERLDVTTRADLCESPQSLEIASLVRHFAERPGFRFPAKGVCRAVRALLDEAWRNDDERELYRIVPRDECVRFADAHEPITLPSALRIAFRLNVPLPALLSGKLEGTNRSILENAEEALPHTIAPISRQRLAATEVLRRRLNRVLDEATSPLPLRDVARKVGVSVGALRYRFPAEARAIVDAHRTEIQRQRTKKLACCRVSVRRQIKNWNSTETKPISRKGLLVALRGSTDLPKNLLRGEIARCIPGDALRRSCNGDRGEP